ncbi:DUF4158 domain-containing protein [Nonomuraea sp. NPDC050547]
MEKVFFLDDADKKLVKACRGPHNRQGYALQLTTVRYGVLPPSVSPAPR